MDALEQLADKFVNKAPQFDSLESLADSFLTSGKYGIEQTEQWSSMPDTKDKPLFSGRISRSPMYQDSATGEKGERQFGQFVPSSKHVSLDKAPKNMSVNDDPNFRSKMAEFIRSQGKRNIGREMIEGVPFAKPIADAGLGVYADPIHPERTVEKLYGFEPTKGAVPSLLNAVNRTLTNPGQQIDEGVYGVGGMIIGALEAASGLDKSKTPGKFLKENAEAIAAPLGLMDVAEAYQTGKTDFTFPKARAAYEQNLPMNLMMAKGGLEGLGKGVYKAGELFETKPSKAAFVKAVNETLDKVMPKTSKQQKTRGTMNVADDQTARAVDVLHRPENADYMPLDLATQERVKPTELNAVTQFDATENIIDSLLKKQNEIIKAENGVGTQFSLQPVIEYWEGVKAKASKGTKGSDVVKYADDQIKILQGKEGGIIDLQSALDDLTIINEDLRHGGMPQPNSVKSKIAGEATLRRQLLDDLLTKSEDARFSDLRKDMGSLLGLRERNAKLVAKLAKQEPIKGSLFGDYSMAQLAYGIAAGNIPSIIKGGTGMGIKAWRTARKDPNYQIRKMHEKAAQVREDGAFRTPVKEIPVVEGELEGREMQQGGEMGGQIGSIRNLARGNEKRRQLKKIFGGDNGKSYSPPVD